MSPDDQSSAPKTEQPTEPETCPVEMSDHKSCGLPICSAPSGVDDEPVCLMHSRNADKDKKLFRREVDAILRCTSILMHRRRAYRIQTDRFDFTGFVFPEASFNGTTLSRDARFTRATFIKEADFRSTEFIGEADFNEAIFAGRANFDVAIFTKGAYFFKARFKHFATFIEAKFKDVAEISKTSFSWRCDFRGARFEQPSRVLFFQVNKDCTEGLRACFNGCRVEEVHFEDVNWYKKGPRMVLQDELDILSGHLTQHELVAESYRQLINNFERTRNYERAEDCSIGAMEMRRLNPEHFAWPFRKLYKRYRWARKLGELFSLVNAYRFLSNYGSSYTRALAVLIILLFVVFGPAFALPWAGLERAATEEIMSPKASGWLQVAEDFQAAMLHSLEVATFQRNRLHVPSGYFGRVVSALETVVIPAQLALLLLALRRRFRR